jgi:L-ascorbate metabolism protein UlaG (beta-lactamase superfamily)
MLFATLLLATLQVGGLGELRIRFIGNEGFELSDGETTILTDLPYQPGASDYMLYDPEALDPQGRVISLITHRHADHFDKALFLERDWSIIGPAEVTDRLPAERVIALSEAIKVGAFTVRPHRTGHSDVEHYSYLVMWRGRRMYFVGDTENPSHLLSVPKLNVAFLTPWLGCTAGAFGRRIDAERIVLYHHRESEGTRGCFDAQVMEQGESFTLTAPPS